MLVTMKESEATELHIYGILYLKFRNNQRQTVHNTYRSFNEALDVSEQRKYKKEVWLSLTH